MVTSPSGAEYHPELIDKRDGFVVVRCVPSERGLHHLDVAYNDLPVTGSPWQFMAEPVQLGQMSAYGAGLSHGVATAPCQFTLETHNNTPGHLSLPLSLCLSVCLCVCLSVVVTVAC